MQQDLSGKWDPCGGDGARIELGRNAWGISVTRAHVIAISGTTKRARMHLRACKSTRRGATSRTIARCVHTPANEKKHRILVVPSTPVVSSALDRFHWTHRVIQQPLLTRYRRRHEAGGGRGTSSSYLTPRVRSSHLSFRAYTRQCSTSRLPPSVLYCDAHATLEQQHHNCSNRFEGARRT